MDGPVSMTVVGSAKIQTTPEFRSLVAAAHAERVRSVDALAARLAVERRTWGGSDGLSGVSSAKASVTNEGESLSGGAICPHTHAAPRLERAKTTTDRDLRERFLSTAWWRA